MYWSYEYIIKKFLPEVKDVWTIKGIVEKTAELGDKTFLVFAPTGQHYSYKQSNILSNRIANDLIKMGLRKGDKVGIYTTNKPEYIFTLFAIGKAGLVEVPINPNLRDSEISHMVNNAGVTTIITESTKEFADIVSKVAQQAPVLKTVIVQGDISQFTKFCLNEKSLNIASLDKMLESSDDADPAVEVSDQDDYCIFFTSGTTGLPKGAVVSNKTFILSALSTGAFPVSSYSRNYTCLPLFHANAQVYSTTAMRCLGACLILSDRFSPKKFWHEIVDFKATYFNSIGGMMQILDAALKEEDVPKHQAEFVLVGGTPVELWERFESKFKVDIYEGYSMSEATVLFGNIHPDKGKRKVGSFGKPTFMDLARKVKVVSDSKDEIRVGTGELMQTGQDFLCKGYWKAPEANNESFDSYGWLRSGDLVRVDEDGYYYFVDRKKFMIRVAGENVSPFEVEDVVNSHPVVSQSAAIPVPDKLRGEEVKVLIKLKESTPSVDLKDIFEHCTKKLAYFKAPRYLEVVTEFPKTATERIQKVKLKELEKKREDHGWDRNNEIPDWKKRYYS
ncbi:MAG: AMP-binding protein [Dethiobacter sp.]|jgi:crotonobetaine/carnitine-CoA ligase|nr:AMP-binding protein [Dethiobacter sp.]